MKTSLLNFRSLLALLALLAGLLGAGALWAAPSQWNTSGGPMATGLGNRAISAMTVSADGKTIYAGTGSGTVFSYDLPPVLSGVGVSGTAQTATLLSATSDRNATGYWIVVARNAAAPTSAQVKAGVGYGGVAIIALGSGAMTAAAAASFPVGGLTAGTDYDLYVIAEDVNGNQALPALVQFSTPVVNTYSISAAANPPAGGTVSCTPNPVGHGAGATCTATANAGYTFASWSGDCTGASCTLSNVTAARSVTANFSGASHAIATAANPVAGGTVSCTPNPVGHGASATCTATANAGYTFASWSGDCTGASCTLSNVTAAKSVTAHFTLLGTKTYTGASATGSGNITGSFTGGGAACGYTVSRFIAVSGVPAPPPAGVNFPHGLFDFTTGGCTPGSTLSFTITYPQALAPNTQYWKYGPTPGNAAPHWYVLPATIAGNTATFSITDGGLGDDDLTANGTVVDQGGPGGGLSDIPTLSEWAMLLLVLLLGAIGVHRARWS